MSENTKKIGPSRLISVEIFQNNKDLSKEEFEKYLQEKIQTHIVEINDLKNKYFVKISFIENEDDPDFQVTAINPDEVHPLDQYELTESITFELNMMGFKANPAKSEAELIEEVNHSLKEKFVEIKKKMKEKIEEVKDGESGSGTDN